MCRNIVRTEKHVKTVRMMSNDRDNLQCADHWTIITSGSHGEGLVMRGSDLDLMHVCKIAEVCEDTNINFKPNITYFTMKMEIRRQVSLSYVFGVIQVHLSLKTV